MADGWKSEGCLPSTYNTPLHVNTTDIPANSDQSDTRRVSSSANAASPRNSTHEAGWASVQRAVNAATAAQNQCTMDHEREQSFSSIRPPVMLPSDQAVVTQSTSYSDWTPASSVWPMSQAEESLPFDFGFTNTDNLHSTDASQSQSPPEATSVSAFSMPADVWPSAVHALNVPTQPTTQPVDHGPTTLSSTQPIDVKRPTPFSPPQADTTFQLPQYPASRRGSASNELTSTFSNFSLVSAASVPSPLRTTSDINSFKRNEGEVDLAARRKRPRPAALGSAALRSRSYGAPSMSPTFRMGNQSPHPHLVRHVKSTGQCLNVRYSGIRKPSSAQRSPLNVATFGELLQSQQLNGERPAGATPPTPVSCDELVAHPFAIHEDGLYSDQEHNTSHEFYYNGQAVNFNMASPPSTPLKPEFYSAHLQAALPPLSAPPQYAVFPDRTPPYSAGPLTGSSWSDAQLASAELSYPFPPVMYPTAQDFNNGVFQNFSAPMQPKTETPYASQSDQKQPEFFIQEFPGQREEHAHAAQQLSHQKPKNYTFTNTTPNDF